jgi:dephospho-CoA kinase
MKVTGITGGIGTGKSTVLSILKGLGFYTINADTLAREVIQKNRPAYIKIIEEFGIDILDSESNIDRKKLSDIVFEDNNRLKKLNSIIHPDVIIAIKGIVEKYRYREEYSGIAVEAPIPVKEFCDLCDEIWYIKAAKETAKNRAQERDNLRYEEIEKRMNVQEIIDYDAIADKTIVNDGDYENLEVSIKNMLK